MATAEIQENVPTLFASSAHSYTLTGLPTYPTGYSMPSSSPVITYWNGTSFTSSCTAGSTQPQEMTITVNGPNNSTGSLSFVVSDFNFVQPAEVAPIFADSSPFVLTEGVGTSWSYTETTSRGSPVPVMTASSLPSGVTFVDNGNGSGTLTGSASIAAGSYTLTLTANNSVGNPVTLTVDLIIASPPVFTSASSVSFVSGSHVSFTVSASDTDSQPPALALDSTLTGAVKNLTFVDNGDGTGTLSGTLVSGTTGTYSLLFEADNSVGVATTQTLTVTIPTAPVFTSGASASWKAGSTVAWTVSATDTDSASPSLSVASGLTGALANLHFVNNGNGTGTLSGTLAGGSGAYTVTFQATNTAGQVTSQSFKVEVPSAPVFTSSSTVSWKSGATVSFTVAASTPTRSHRRSL